MPGLPAYKPSPDYGPRSCVTFPAPWISAVTPSLAGVTGWRLPYFPSCVVAFGRTGKGSSADVIPDYSRLWRRATVVHGRTGVRGHVASSRGEPWPVVGTPLGDPMAHVAPWAIRGVTGVIDKTRTYRQPDATGTSPTAVMRTLWALHKPTCIRRRGR